MSNEHQSTEGSLAALKDLALRAIDQREAAHSKTIIMESGGFSAAVWWEGKQLCIGIVRPTRQAGE